MGDANVQGRIIKTARSTAGGYSDQDEGGVRPKGMCHVTLSQTTISVVDFILRKAKAVARSILYDFCFSGLSVMTFPFCFFRVKFTTL